MRGALCAVGAVLLGILIAFGPWLVKQAVETGNPVYPIGSKIFKTQGWDDTLEERFRQAHRPVKEGDFSAAEIGRMLQRTFLSSTEMMPFAFAFLGLLFLPVAAGQRPRGLAGLLAWWAAVFVLWLCLTHRLERFLYPLHALAAVLAGAGCARLAGRGRWAAFASMAVLLMFVQLMLLLNFYFIGRPATAKIAWGLEGKQKLLETLSTWRSGRIISALPQGKMVLALGDAEGYLLPANVQTAVVFSVHPLETALRKSASAGELARNLKEMGYTHLYIKWQELARLHCTYYKAYAFNEAEQKILREFFETQTLPAEPLASRWPEWKDSLRLPESAARDFAAYREKFAGQGADIRENSPYLKARPWLGSVAKEISGAAEAAPESYYSTLFADYATLLAPGEAGSPPPLATAPSELFELK